MSEKIYLADYWGERQLVIGLGGGMGKNDLIAIGEVLAKNAERFVHIKQKDLIDALIQLGVIKKNEI